MTSSAFTHDHSDHKVHRLDTKSTINHSIHIMNTVGGILTMGRTELQTQTHRSGTKIFYLNSFLYIACSSEGPENAPNTHFETKKLKIIM